MIRFFCFSTLIFFILSSCVDDTPESSVVIIEQLEFSSEGTIEFTSDLPEMHIDSSQSSTFLKFDNDSIRIRINFRGFTPGLYTNENGIFYYWTYNSDGSRNIELICDTFTGIEVDVTKYGDIGESIEGTFSANQCDGVSGNKTVKGSFIVERTE